MQKDDELKQHMEHLLKPSQIGQTVENEKIKEAIKHLENQGRYLPKQPDIIPLPAALPETFVVLCFSPYCGDRLASGFCDRFATVSSTLVCAVEIIVLWFLGVWEFWAFNFTPGVIVWTSFFGVIVACLLVNVVWTLLAQRRYQRGIGRLFDLYRKQNEREEDDDTQLLL